MKALLEDLRSGQVSSHNIPEPELRAGGILIRTAFSAISAGTERAKIESGEKSLLGKALARPDLTKQVIDYALKEGIRAAYQRVQNRLDTLSPLGYSCAGTVIAVNADEKEFRVGDRVACGGGGYANHSEINFVPRNLAVRIPDTVSLDAASLTTIGAIAMQGVRQSQLTFGETVAVIGAGLVGVLTMQLVKAAGCRVIAFDLDEKRIQHAREMGADLALSAADKDAGELVKQFTKYGADAAIITAAAPSADPTELAARVCRDRGRIVVVGAVGLGVSRENVYNKELSITLSRSYGPGRYDPSYEEDGIDYPIGYVRWTERRNMEAFLQLLAAGKLKLDALVERRFPVEQGGDAYAELRRGGAYTVLIQYPASSESVTRTEIPVHQTRSRIEGQLRVGCIGAGSFARNIIFPRLQKNQGVTLGSVATASGVAAESARKSFGFANAQTPAQLLQAPDLDAVFIASHHSSHAGYVVDSLANNKQVFVEKPLAISREELDAIQNTYETQRQQGRSPFVMVGFNRRFAPLTKQLRDFFAGRREPMVVHARINAGYIAPQSWIQHADQGGRIIGEMCHFVDWARSVIGSPIEKVSAQAIPDSHRYNRDNVAATLTFADGSIANLLYLANGDSSVAKEHFEVFCEGRIARLNDFETLELARNGKTSLRKAKRDKGHDQELDLTIAAMRDGTESPIGFTELLEVTDATFAIVEAISTGQQVETRRARSLQSESSTPLVPECAASV